MSQPVGDSRKQDAPAGAAAAMFTLLWRVGCGSVVPYGLILRLMLGLVPVLPSTKKEK